MPVSRTKNALPPDMISGMTLNAFDVRPERVTELTEGYFNAAFRVSLPERDVILKVAPPPDVPVMTHEKGILRTETEVMSLVREKTRVPVPRVLYADTSRTLCGSEYFYMEALCGQSFSACEKDMSAPDRDAVREQMGAYTRSLNDITGDAFGYYGQKDKQGARWRDVFKDICMDPFRDAERLGIDLPIGWDDVARALDGDARLFDQVTVPRLVHWDIWAGNVFVQGARVTGIIDFERALWADPLMEVGFRTYGLDPAFFSGYGKPALTPDEARRAHWYDAYLFLIQCLECDYRGYETHDLYPYSCRRLVQIAEGLGVPARRSME